MKEKSSIPKSVGIWIRVSTEDQARGDSPEHHLKRARAYAESQEWTVREVYHLEGVSGKTVSQHPEAQRMLQDVARGHISALIFSKLARLARNTRELLDFADRFQEHKANLVSLQEAFDTSTPAGRLFFTIIAAMAEWERSEIVDRVRASISIRAKLGKNLGGAAPYGYQWKDKKLVIHPEEAPIRIRMYELFAERRQCRTVARLLNEAGYRTRNGSRWSDTSVARLIEDTTAKGQYRANHTFRDAKGKLCQKPETDWVFTPCEAIVSEELWKRCDDVFRTRDSKPLARRPGVHLFTGLLHCSCGWKMYVHSRTPKYVCSRCRTKIPMEDLESIFRDELRAFALSADAVQRHLKEANEQIRARQEALAAHVRNLEKVRNEQQKLYQLYMDGEIPSEGFGKRYGPLEERVKELENAVPKLEGEVDALRVREISAEDVVAEAANLHATWPRLTDTEKRRIIESLTEKIVVDGTEITITLCGLPSSEELTKMQRTLWDSSPR